MSFNRYAVQTKDKDGNIYGYMDKDGRALIAERLPMGALFPENVTEGYAFILTGDVPGYEKGLVYQYQKVAGSDPAEYEWVPISSANLNAGKGITIGEDKSINADTNIFHGTLDEFNALDAEEKAKYSHISTPESDDPLVPSAKVTQLSDGARIDITDQNGTTTATVRNVADELIPSVSKYQSGSVGNPEITNGKSSGFYKSLQVTFDETMPDTDYQVTLAMVGSYWAEVDVAVGTRTTTGFTLLFKYTHGTAEPATLTIAENSFQVKWQAFKLMTDAALLADEAQIEQNKADIATLKTSVATNKADIATLKTSVATNTSDIAALKTSVATNTTDISVLKTCTQAVCTSVKIKGYGLTARKSGKVVTVNGVTQFSAELTRNSWVEIAALPSGYRPSNYEYGTAVVDSGEGSVTCPIDVAASGSMRIFIYEKSIPTTLSLNGHYLFISLCFMQN